VERPRPTVPNGPLVVGVDESERSRDAIALGAQLAQALPGELMLVYVHTLQELDALMTGHDPEEVEQLVAADAGAKQAKAAALAAEMGISQVRLRRATSAAAGLHAQAVESNAGLVVIGPSSRSGLGRVLPGATAGLLLSRRARLRADGEARILRDLPQRRRLSPPHRRQYVGERGSFGAAEGNGDPSSRNDRPPRRGRARPGPRSRRGQRAVPGAKLSRAGGCRSRGKRAGAGDCLTLVASCLGNPIEYGLGGAALQHESQRLARPDYACLTAEISKDMLTLSPTTTLPLPSA
jgi:nucleotide-binding universal stress UspA family protein